MIYQNNVFYIIVLNNCSWQSLDLFLNDLFKFMYVLASDLWRNHKDMTSGQYNLLILWGEPSVVLKIDLVTYIVIG